jgi:hypothetical protein
VLELLSSFSILSFVMIMQNIMALVDLREKALIKKREKDAGEIATH